MPILELKHISKSFDGLKANDSIDFKANPGTINAIAGENGAGKSTLMKILYGIHQPDEGEIIIDGKVVSIENPSDAIKNKIGMVHQHFMIVPNMTCLENIILGTEITNSAGVMNKKKSEEKIFELCTRFHIKINLNEKAGRLSVSSQQKLELLKLLYKESDILILDEPTAVLTPGEVKNLFLTLKELAFRNKTIIVITHKLNEIFSLCDTVTVLKNGKKIIETELKNVSLKELGEMITGGISENITRDKTISENVSVLTVQNAAIRDDNGFLKVQDLELQLNNGEITGIAGAEGNGQLELAEALTGMREFENCTLIYKGKENRITKAKLKFNFAHIPEDRIKHGSVNEYNISENLVLGRIREKNFSSGWKIYNDKINKFGEDIIHRFNIKPEDVKFKAGQMSGGNRQKMLIAREMTKESEIVIVNQPTRGLDINSSIQVHNFILEEKAKGKSILLISSDLEELLKLSDKILILYDGTIIKETTPLEVTEEELGKLLMLKEE